MASYYTDKLGYRRPAPAIGFYRENGVIHPITERGIHEHTPNRKLTEYHPRKFERKKRGYEPLSISPAVRHAYHNYKVEYDRDRMNGMKRKHLPEGAFERYYRSRKAAFEAMGGSATTFNEAFDSIDSAQAVDSWSDLDSELKANNIYASREDVSEIKRKAREEARENREIERSYKQYLREQKKERAAA